MHRQFSYRPSLDDLVEASDEEDYDVFSERSEDDLANEAPTLISEVLAALRSRFWRRAASLGAYRSG
ncbi:unnamed protein product, partial [Mesorhabditis spiculigera]